jgi:hypothetical protein
MRSKNGFVCAVSCLAVIFISGSLSAQDVTLPLSAIQVKHFTQADGVGKTPEFLEYFYQGLLTYMPKTKVAAQVLGEDAAAPEGGAANGLIVEGQILFAGHKGMIGVVRSEVSLYRLGDHSLFKTLTIEVPYKRSPLNKDKNVGENTGGRTAFEIQKQLKKLKAS